MEHPCIAHTIQILTHVSGCAVVPPAPYSSTTPILHSLHTPNNLRANKGGNHLGTNTGSFYKVATTICNLKTTLSWDQRMRTTLSWDQRM